MFLQQKPVGVAWILKWVFEEITTEAERVAPYETGGILMGYWLEEKEVVITDVIGPGLDAKHGGVSFEPDYPWQEKEVARIYEASGRRHTYLGDWHSHPHGGPGLSSKDRRTLKRIASYGPARAVTPVMGILTAEASWCLKIWLYPKKKNYFRRRPEVLETKFFVW